jgi:predicted transcriptional regulator
MTFSSCAVLGERAPQCSFDTIGSDVRRRGYEQIAELLGIGRATVSRTLRLYRETGDLKRRPITGGNFSVFRDLVAELLMAIVETMPDVSIVELTRTSAL